MNIIWILFFRRLIYGRILFPSSKLSTYELSSELLEPPDFELHQIYRALEVIAKETDFIQSSLYQNSLLLSKRNSGILYYDCTNYFFEIEEGEGLKQYGLSKDHKPNPIVQMGLFMDGDGIPLAFSVTEGNKNEQLTLKPLEKRFYPISNFQSLLYAQMQASPHIATENLTIKVAEPSLLPNRLKSLKLT